MIEEINGFLIQKLKKYPNTKHIKIERELHREGGVKNHLGRKTTLTQGFTYKSKDLGHSLYWTNGVKPVRREQEEVNKEEKNGNG